MMALETWIETPLANALGWALLHSLWQGAIAATGVAAVLLTTRAPRVRYAASCVALAGLFAAFWVTVALGYPRQADWLRQSLMPSPPAWNLPDVSTSPALTNWGLAEAVPWLAALWIFGVCICVTRQIGGWISVERLKRRGVCAAPEHWHRTLSELAARMGVTRSVMLVESCFVEVPMLVGHVKPMILAPVGLLAGLPAAQVEAILLHELAHVRRFDYLVNLCQRWIETVMFYHPAVWWITGVVRVEREHCCDDAVVLTSGDAEQYAQALAVIEQSRWPEREAVVAASGGNLSNRIRRLLFPNTTGTSVFPAAVVAVAFAAVLSAWQAAPVTQDRTASTGSPYERWLHEDVAYIAADEEHGAFGKLRSDEEREKFIEQFWLRRDPTPGSEQNEFKIEHYRRIAYANQRFAVSAKPGWRTDRGYMYIVYGPPDEIESHPQRGVHPYTTQVWKYRLIDGVGQNLFVTFIDRTNTGDYRLAPGRSW